MRFFILMLITLIANLGLTQVDITIQPNSIDTSLLNIDISDFALRIPLQVSLNNNESEVATLDWEVDNSEFVNEWEFQISDNNHDFLFNTLSSPTPIILDALAEEQIFVFHFYPRSLAGCGKLKILFNEQGATEVIDSVVYKIEVNEDNCLSTGLEIIENLSGITIFPNPTSSTINIRAALDFDKIEVIDIFGKLKINSKEQFINVRNLSSGMYFLKCYQGANFQVKPFLKN